MGKETEKETLTVDAVAVEPDVPLATPVPATKTETVTYQLVEVIAPSNLAEGYQFEAEANGQRFLVTVPPGGVKEGQQFTVKVPPGGSAAVSAAMPGIAGAWKDGLFNCCRYGCCHAHLCLALWCTPIALAQVMTRMRLNWLGQPGSVKQVASTFKTVVGIWILYLIIDQILSFAVYSMYPEYQQFDPEQYESSQAMWENAPTGAIVMHYVQEIWQFIFWIYILIATCRTRSNIRRQYEIPEQSCRGCEDCCCAFWCQCCTTMQMMRHTADYDSHPASCCTETGLPRHVDTV